MTMSSNEPYEVVLGSGKWVREETEEESDRDGYSMNNVTWRRAVDRQERMMKSDIELITNLIDEFKETAAAPQSSRPSSATMEAAAYKILKKYVVGSTKLDTFTFRVLFFPSMTCKLLKCFSHLFWMFCMMGAGYALEFTTISCVSFAWIIFNIILKLICIETNSGNDSFRSPQCGLYKCIRMMDSQMFEDFRKKNSDIVPATTTLAIIMIPFMTFFTLGFYLLAYMSLKTTSTWWSYVIVITNFVVFLMNPLNAHHITFYFFNACDKMAMMCEKFKIEEFIDEKETVYDVDKCFENYYLMCDAVDSFSRAFATYFFIAEFTLILFFVFLGFGLSEEIGRFRDSSGYEAHCSLIRIGMLSSLSFAMLLILMCLMIKASKVSENCNKEAMVNKMSARSSEHAELKNFTNHVLRTNGKIGFGAMGILVNNSFSLQCGYFAATIVVFYVNFLVLGIN